MELRITSYELRIRKNACFPCLPSSQAGGLETKKMLETLRT